MPGTALTGYIAPAFYLLNVYQVGAPITAANAQQALQLLNNMLGGWAQITATQTVVAREVVATVSGKGGPSNPYTWGPGGDISSAKPANQNSVTGAALVLTTPSPTVEVPLAVLTDDMWQAIQIKDLSNSQPTCVYYQASFATTGLGTLNLWPVPNTGMNTLALYRRQQVGPFADLSATSYYFQEGMDEALMYNLAKRLCAPFGRPVPPDIDEFARESFAGIQRANAKMSDMMNDMAWSTQRGLYNINTGNM